MLRLEEVGNRVRQPTKKFMRLVGPHIAYVILVALYLLFGAQVFFSLERPHDQRARIMAKMRLNREIRYLTTLIYYQSRYYNATAPTPSANTATSPGTHFETDFPIESVEEFGNGSGIDPTADLLYQLKLLRIAETEQIEKQIFQLLYRWEDSIRNYDIRATHVFTEDFLIDQRWEHEDITNTHLEATDSRWTFSSSVLFAFTVITTIGYGNLAPSTFWGRFFCMIYGLIGIPLTMVCIANTGRFLSEGASMIVNEIRRERQYYELKKRTILNQKRRSSRLAGQFFQEAVKKEDIEVKPLARHWGRLTLLTTFFTYIVLGALCLPLWEEMSFFDAFYFNFITITTVGFGDIVPRRYEYLFPTLIYMTIGLAITTLTVEIFGGLLRQLHYLGKKITGAKNVFVWFGNKMLTVQELVTAIGRQYGIPQGEIESLNLNLDQVIKETVEHKEEEIRIRRLSSKRKGTGGRNRVSRDDSKLAPLFADYEFRYIDEDSLAGTPMYKDARFVLWKNT